jgi:hypothetical protein
VRVKDCTAFTTERQLPIPAHASAAGVVLDVLVDRLGSSHHKRKIHEPVRLVEIQTDSSRLVLLTDQLEMPADLIALAYRYRWSVDIYQPYNLLKIDLTVQEARDPISQCVVTGVAAGLPPWFELARAGEIGSSLSAR